MLRSTRRNALLGGLTAMAIAITGLVASQTFAGDDIETPRYEVVSTHDAFEVRRYAPRLVAEVEVTGSPREATSAGFRVLADYIFGNNTARGSIAMTAPVDRRATSEPIAMTAPVDRRKVGEDERWVVTFTMPSRYTLETLPAPNDERVQIRVVPTAHFAAVRFSGAPSEARVQERMNALLAVVDAEGLQAAGSPPTYARYDPPWTLPMLRRNEILLELVVDGAK
jgi:SOUL heme-binding protein